MMTLGTIQPVIQFWKEFANSPDFIRFFEVPIIPWFLFWGSLQLIHILRIGLQRRPDVQLNPLYVSVSFFFFFLISSFYRSLFLDDLTYFDSFGWFVILSGFFLTIGGKYFINSIAIGGSSLSSVRKALKIVFENEQILFSKTIENDKYEQYQLKKKGREFELKFIYRIFGDCQLMPLGLKGFKNRVFMKEIMAKLRKHLKDQAKNFEYSEPEMGPFRILKLMTVLFWSFGIFMWFGNRFF